MEEHTTKQPVIEFKTQEELDASLAEWQERLFLTDWIILAELRDVKDMPQPNCMGHCSKIDELKSAQICIRRHTIEDMTGEIIRPCQEKVLVHELLHCKRLIIEADAPDISSLYWQDGEHAHIEQMAKSLIMAKYGISFDWFKSF